MAHFDLLHNGIMVHVLILDRIFDRYDVIAATDVDQAE